MLIIMDRKTEVKISDLTDVYVQRITEIRNDFYSNCSCFEAETAAQNRFEGDLEDFLRMPNAKIFAWETEGRCVSALRAEPYLDGVLISYLETVPSERGRGYAKILVGTAVKRLTDLGIKRIYSHVNKHNGASLAVHFANGFVIHADHAKLLDGTVTQNYYTLICESTAG